MPPARRSSTLKSVETITHEGERRTLIPTAEYQSMVDKETAATVPVEYDRGVEGLEEEKAERNRDLDPQLVWRGKDEQDWSDLVVQAPPLYIQEKVHPKVLIDDLMRASADHSPQATDHFQMDLFADFNGVEEGADKTDFYAHDANWTNRMILGDSLHVMASLAEREGLRGKVQCIYIDPPYGIRFNSNFQWSTTSRDVKDGNAAHITREPEQVKAFRDTWRDGIHSYLTYLRDRLTVARDLLTDSGSVFVQIGDENIHRVRALMDEVFGEENFISSLSAQKTGSVTGDFVQSNIDYVLWYGRSIVSTKYRPLFVERDTKSEISVEVMATSDRQDFSAYPLTSDGFRETTTKHFAFEGRVFHPGNNRHWGVTVPELERVGRAGRIVRQQTQVRMRYFWDDFPVIGLGSYWNDVGGATGKTYVVQTAPKVIQRCILMATDPGDLVLDPTCGSGTTAYVAEQWGRRWITVDTSRVALALARARIMGARYPYYLLADSSEGQQKEAGVTRRAPSTQPTFGNIRQGFVYERVPHITLKSIANNAEIDVIYDEYQPRVQQALDDLNTALRGHATPFRVATGGRQGKDVRFDAPGDATFTMPSGEAVNANELVEWEVPREAPADWPASAEAPLAAFWEARIARQKAIDASIAARAEFEYLYDRPYVDNKRVRVAGPFTVESLSPHRMLGVDENGDVIDSLAERHPEYDAARSFDTMILENLKMAGVQQAHKEGRITFTSLAPWPGHFVCAEGRFGSDEWFVDSGQSTPPTEAGAEKRAAVFIGPEFGTVSRPDLVEAAREAADAGFDVLIACAFNFDAHSSEFERLGRVPVLKARMNADLHMANDLKNTGAGNLFVIFGEPDIDVLDAAEGQVQVRVNGVDVFHPQTGKVQSDGPDGIACWFIDTDYNEESFFVRHAYFLGANDPYKSLKTTLKAEINEEAWESLNRDTSRPFPKPASGRIAIKVINHLGDEVMKVFRVG